MGRKAHRPDPTSRRQVDAMAGYGVPELAIARVIAIDAKTLRKHYRDELDTGQIKATAKVAESLFRKATTDGAQSVTAAIFWLKTRGGCARPLRIITLATMTCGISPTKNWSGLLWRASLRLPTKASRHDPRPPRSSICQRSVWNHKRPSKQPGNTSEMRHKRTWLTLNAR